METPKSWIVPHTCMNCNNTTSVVYVNNTTETVWNCQGCGRKIDQVCEWIHTRHLPDHDVNEIMKYLPNHNINLNGVTPKDIYGFE